MRSDSAAPGSAPMATKIALVVTLCITAAVTAGVVRTELGPRETAAYLLILSVLFLIRVAGQLLVVLTVASALALLRSRSEVVSRRLAFAGSLVVMAAGAFWFVQRVFFSGGTA